MGQYLMDMSARDFTRLKGIVKQGIREYRKDWNDYFDSQAYAKTQIKQLERIMEALKEAERKNKGIRNLII